MTKHNQILKYIESLTIGEKISVRTIAKEMQVSEGTAYRAIKEAERQGIVSTIERVGTVRIAKQKDKTLEKLTFADVVSIVEGEYLGGSNGKEKHLEKFVIGAMEEEAILRYISKGSLMIVGNRLAVQKQALEHGAAVLITGGFDTTDEIKELANQKKLPLISTSYDSFTVATLINQALSNQLIKRKIITVADVMTPLSKIHFLTNNNKVKDYRLLEQKTGMLNIPVINQHNILLGMMTPKNALGKDDEQSLVNLLEASNDWAKETMTIAAIAHLMIWKDYDVIPVIRDDKMLVGIITRQAVMRAMQNSQRQLQSLNTFSEQLAAEVVEKNNDDKIYYETVAVPNMINNDGIVSSGVIAELVTDITKKFILKTKHVSVLLEKFELHYFKVIQIDKLVQFFPKILAENKHALTMDVELYIEGQIMARATVVCHIINE